MIRWSHDQTVRLSSDQMIIRAYDRTITISCTDAALGKSCVATLLRLCNYSSNISDIQSVYRCIDHMCYMIVYCDRLIFVHVCECVVFCCSFSVVERTSPDFVVLSFDTLQVTSKYPGALALSRVFGTLEKKYV